MSDLLNSIGGTNSFYKDQYSEATSKLQEQLNTTDYSKATDEELYEACRSFEQYFLEQAMKGMEKMIPKDEDESKGTSYTEMFKDTLYKEYAEIASNQTTGTAGQKGIGMAQMLYEQMKRNYASTPVEELAQNAVASGATKVAQDEE